jgi:hypothetical protein
MTDELDNGNGDLAVTDIGRTTRSYGILRLLDALSRRRSRVLVPSLPLHVLPAIAPVLVLNPRARWARRRERSSAVE